MTRSDVPHAVRQRIAVEPSSRRRLDERLALAWPSLATWAVAAVQRLPAESRLRRVVLRQFLLRAIAAANRGDYAAAFLLYDDRSETHFDTVIAALGLDSVYRGAAARADGERRWRVEWSDLRYLPEEMLDLGNGRLVVLGRIRGTGAASGAPFDSEWAMVITLSGGRVQEDRIFMDRAAALDAAGQPTAPA